MEPSSAPNGPEQGSFTLPSAQELSSNDNQSNPEVSAPAAQEVAPASREGANQNQGMTLPSVQQTPVVAADPAVAVTPPAQAAPTTGAGPVVADDTDVIEKEWVSKAKNIINETRDNPHEQEKAVSKLQADYLRKRYGKEIKLSEG